MEKGKKYEKKKAEGDKVELHLGSVFLENMDD